MEVLTGIDAGLIRLRRPTADDAEPLLAILTDDAVREWWGAADEAAVEALIATNSPLATFLVMEVDGRVVGGIRVREEPDPDRRHARIDMFVAPRWQGRGIGSRALRAVARHLFDQGHHRLTVDPHALNQPAIAAYARVGFRPVGIMRRYVRDPRGHWADGLLMDLVVEELKS